MANHDTAVKLLQAMLQAEFGTHDITPSFIAGKLDWLLQHGPQFGIDPDRIDRQATVDEMVRRFSLWIGHDTLLTSDTGHEAWLVSARKEGWRYWPRYRDWLDASLPAAVIDAMDRSTDTVLGLLEDPLRQGAWDRRGLVVGNVQSGKTGHYIGLVSKAADAGYKIVIVLAGLHNNLRSQTQRRLDEGFLGYETTPREEDIRAVGVGTLDGDPSVRPNFATNRTNSGDFTTRVARNLGISPEQRPWLFVVKKNRTVLERLLRWIRNHVADLHDPETDRRVVTKLPLLMIDDEADHASVDTGEQVVDADGRPDEDHQPTAINRLVRRILHAFAQSAYVGYTATPFANIFIHERGTTRQEGADLFPAAFIVNLAAPSDYENRRNCSQMSPAASFGLRWSRCPCRSLRAKSWRRRCSSRSSSLSLICRASLDERKALASAKTASAAAHGAGLGRSMQGTPVRYQRLAARATQDRTAWKQFNESHLWVRTDPAEARAILREHALLKPWVVGSGKDEAVEIRILNGSRRAGLTGLVTCLAKLAVKEGGEGAAQRMHEFLTAAADARIPADEIIVVHGLLVTEAVELGSGARLAPYEDARIEFDLPEDPEPFQKKPTPNAAVLVRSLKFGPGIGRPGEERGLADMYVGYGFPTNYRVDLETWFQDAKFLVDLLSIAVQAPLLSRTRYVRLPIWIQEIDPNFAHCRLSAGPARRRLREIHDYPGSGRLKGPSSFIPTFGGVTGTDPRYGNRSRKRTSWHSPR